MTWKSAEALDAEIFETVGDAMRDGYFTCGIELQKAHVEKLANLRDRLKAARYASINKGDEPWANSFFRAQMIVSGTCHFLEMWIRLKEEKLDEAWDHLAESRMDLRIAQKIVYDPATNDVLIHLDTVEATVFPPQAFSSSAYTYTESFCTICDQPFGDCEHLSGKIYMGRICNRRIPSYELSEYSIVLEPRDRRCRSTSITENGKVHCTLTHREIPQDKPVDPSVKAMSFVIMRFD
jgi:hypothetical protein